MNQKLYSIRIDKTGRYVTYCDKCWYETGEDELRIFTKEQCERIKAQMKNHYVYKLTISDGEEIILQDLPKVQPASFETSIFDSGSDDDFCDLAM